MHTPPLSLVERAVSRFSPFRPQEALLIANLSPQSPPLTVVQEYAQLYSVRAAFIRWLCTDSVATKCLKRAGGLHLSGACVQDELDLRYLRVPFPVTFENCTFSKMIMLEHAQCSVLRFTGSKLTGISGDRLIVDKECSLDRGFESSQPVSLMGAKIRGQLICREAKFMSPGDAAALNLNHAHIESGLFLNKRFESHGTVNLVSTHVDGQVNCEGGRFVSRNGVAINASQARFTGGLRLRSTDTNPTILTGSCRLTGARIEQQCTFSGTQIEVESPTVAIDANHASFKGSVLVRSTKTSGDISFRHARVAETFELSVPHADAPETTQSCSLEFARLSVLRIELEHRTSFDLNLNGCTYEQVARLAKPIILDDVLRLLAASNTARAFDSQPYTQLARVLAMHGRDSDSRRVLIARERARTRYAIDLQNSPGIRLLRRYILDPLIGYGYDPRGTGYASLLTILISALIISLPHPSPYLPTDEPVLIPLYYAFDIFIPGIDLGYADRWDLPLTGESRIETRFGSLPANPILLVVEALLTILGWLLTTVMVAALTGVLRFGEQIR